MGQTKPRCIVSDSFDEHRRRTGCCVLERRTHSANVEDRPMVNVADKDHLQETANACGNKSQSQGQLRKEEGKIEKREGLGGSQVRL